MTLFDGQQVDGPAGLRTALMRYSPQFVRMFVEKLMTYAGPRAWSTDMPTIRAIARDVAKDDNRFSAIVLEWCAQPAVPDAGGRRQPATEPPGDRRPCL